MRKIAINGSRERQGEVAKHLEQIGLPIVHLQDGIELAVDAVLEAEVVVFGTPVLWFNVSALMKQLIETLPEAPKYPYDGIWAYLFALGNEDGCQQAINQMFAPLSHMGFRFPPYASQFVNTSMKGKSEDQWQDNATAFLREQIRRL